MRSRSRGSAVSIPTERQREAVLAGLELGYYETPRRSTHEDVAERIGCSPSTASEHLNRAESKLIKAMLNPDSRPRADESTGG